MNNTPLIVLTTFPDFQSAQKTAHEIISNRLAACVNILPQVNSVYEWEGSIETQQEHMLMIKTPQHCFSSLEEAIRNLHPYELPEVIATPITHGSRDYLNWVRSQTIALTE